MLPAQIKHAALWPNPAAQASGTKCLQNGDFVVEPALRPHEHNRLRMRTRKWALRELHEHARAGVFERTPSSGCCGRSA